MCRKGNSSNYSLPNSCWNHAHKATELHLAMTSDEGFRSQYHVAVLFSNVPPVIFARTSSPDDSALLLLKVPHSIKIIEAESPLQKTFCGNTERDVRIGVLTTVYHLGRLVAPCWKLANRGDVLRNNLL